jgi:hypothetical protein
VCVATRVPLGEERLDHNLWAGHGVRHHDLAAGGEPHFAARGRLERLDVGRQLAGPVEKLSFATRVASDCGSPSWSRSRVAAALSSTVRTVVEGGTTNSATTHAATQDALQHG